MASEDLGGKGRVLVVGAGLMGHGIALDLARHGYPVSLNDISQDLLDRALNRIGADLQWMAGRGLVDEGQIAETLGRIRTTPDLAAAAEGVDFVVEAVFEDLDLKERIFADLDRLCPPHAILASNTSGLSANRLAAATRRPEKVLVTHFYNPPHLMPLVEVVKAEATGPETVEAVVGLLRRIGKTAVVLRKEVPGFIGNRLQFALLREAFHLVEEGIASPEEIDTVLKLTLGRRYGTIGPLETADLAGLDLFLSISSYLFPELASGKEPPRAVQERVARGELGVKSGRGFYSWTPEKAQEVIRARDAELARWMKG